MKIDPMIASSGKLFDSPDWVYEFDYHGLRSLLVFDGQTVKLIGKSGKDITKKYPELLSVVYSLKCKSCVLDGEIIVEKDGIPNFYLLQKRDRNTDRFRIEILSKMYPAKYVTFDILYLNGKSVKGKSLIERKELLNKYVNDSSIIFKSPYIVGSGSRLYDVALKLGFSGILAKRKNSKYRSGVTKDWINIRKVNIEDFVILGYIPDGDTFSSLILGGYRNNHWFFVSKVGNGFTEETKQKLMKQFKEIKTRRYFDLPDHTSVVFVKPKLVCKVEFLDRTPNKKLRLPIFKGLVKDKKPEECRYEILY